MRRFGHKLLEWVRQILFPRRCPVCDEIVVPFGEKICLECMGKLRLLTPPYCMKCGKKLHDEGEFCPDCQERTHIFDRGRALYEYGSVAPSVYRLKYCGRQEYADFFGEEIARYLGDFLEEIQPDALLPIPLHKKRLRRRGYNQAALIAGALGRCMGIPVRNGLLVRVKNTVPLKRLNPKERQNNLKKAFTIHGNDVKLKVVVLIDDIYTTGSTLDEAARVLRHHGVEYIYYITLACGAGV